MNLFLNLKDGVTLTGWSMYKTEENHIYSMDDFNGGETYFVLYVQGYHSSSWKFSIELQVSEKDWNFKKLEIRTKLLFELMFVILSSHKNFFENNMNDCWFCVDKLYRVSNRNILRFICIKIFLKSFDVYLEKRSDRYWISGYWYCTSLYAWKEIENAILEKSYRFSPSMDLW